MEQKTEKQKNMLIITTFLGYGDVLYMTPFLKWFPKVGYTVDVWACNCEPLYCNPHIRFLKKLDQRNVNIPKTQEHLIFQKFDSNSNNIHTVDWYSMKACNFMLRNIEKDLVFTWRDSDIDYCRKLLKKHELISNEDPNCNFVVISPTITWPSRTLPLQLYKDLIKKIQLNGDKVVIVGKTIQVNQNEMVGSDLVKNEQKNMYPISEFEGAIDLVNKLTFSQLCAFYSLSKIAVNTENGNMVASCTNDKCWNLYIAGLNSPEFRLPWRKGSQEYKTKVVKNDDDYFPTADYVKYLNNASSVINIPVRLPSVDKIYGKYLEIYSTL
jgi:hypothetical protein